MLTKVTGTGCMTTTLIGCAAASSKDYLLAALCGIQTMNVAAETAFRALKEAEGPGTFKTRLLDAVYLLSAEKLVQMSKLRQM